MVNKQIAYVIQYHDYTHTANKQKHGFGIAGTILIIIVPLIVWLIFKQKDK
jgi:hypothetical protein